MLERRLTMTAYTVSFFGHRTIKDPLRIERQLETLIRKLLKEKAYVEFLVGRDGEFDQLVSSAIRRCKRTFRDDNSAHVWVLPYLTAEFRDNEVAFRDYYDEIEVCEAAAGSHYKNAHQTRNRAMVDRSDLIVFCIQQESGGAWQTMKYAKKQSVPYINLNDPMEYTAGTVAEEDILRLAESIAVKNAERNAYQRPSIDPKMR